MNQSITLKEFIDGCIDSIKDAVRETKHAEMPNSIDFDVFVAPESRYIHIEGIRSKPQQVLVITNSEYGSRLKFTVKL